MKPDDLLALAAQLIPLGTEAALRAAVSRAYYGAFHSAVALINEVGVALPAGPESHTKVRYCLMESDEPPAREAGRALYYLRTLRNLADYDLAATDEFRGRTVITAVDQARHVVMWLAQCREGAAATRFRTKLRDYAANVLRLPVTGT